MLLAMRVPGLEVSIDDGNVPWLGTRVEGVSWLPLHLSGDGPANDGAVLIRMEPGRGYPSHRHIGVEEVLVLAGAYEDGAGIHRAGSYVRYEEGSVHSPVAAGDPSRPASADNPACVLFAIARAGIEAV
jgi:anti-sigma factor ChrR (cupin superfamily)